MLAEAAHSAADTLNQAFLLKSVHQSERPADAEHPFGYGQERYFWSLLAAFGIFLAGAGFSVSKRLLALRHGSDRNQHQQPGEQGQDRVVGAPPPGPEGCRS